MQKAQSSWVFLTWSLYFISKFFVTILSWSFCFPLFLGFALYNIHAYHIWLFLFVSLKKKINKNGKRDVEGCVLYYISWICNQGWLYYLYITCLCTLFSLDELILLHFASFGFVVHVVWELFIFFDHMILILILKSHAFNCKD